MNNCDPGTQPRSTAGSLNHRCDVTKRLQLFRPSPPNTAPRPRDPSTAALSPHNTQSPVQPTHITADLACAAFDRRQRTGGSAKLNLRSTPRVSERHAANIVKEIFKDDRLIVIGGPNARTTAPGGKCRRERRDGWVREALADQRLVRLAAQQKN